MAKDYQMSKCIGPDNVQKAIQEKINETPPWEVHSIVPAGLTTVQHPLQPGQAVAIMNFLVLFEREFHNA